MLPADVFASLALYFSSPARQLSARRRRRFMLRMPPPLADVAAASPPLHCRAAPD